MAIDPVDIARDEARRSENRRSAERKESNQKASAQDFAGRYQARLKTKESQESQSRDADQSKKEGELLGRLISVFKSKEDAKDQDHRETAKKEDSKKEKFQDESTESRFKTVADDGHARIASKQGSQEGGGGAGGGTSGQSSGGQTGSQSGSRGEGGFSGSGKQGEKKGHAGGARFSKAPIGSFSVGRVGKNSNDRDGKSGNQSQFSEKVLDEIVESVRVTVNDHMETEMEINLSHDYFSGLKIRAHQSSQGVVLTFICPNRSVKDIFLVNRVKIYQRLKEKKISVSRIEVIT